ncbi:MAG: hypothetical protein M2R45_03517 [Verrucomicrobia subdivision 3 bacterium]|nr:hypothetical protein [Limisphaerales bacterium]MCS1415914.1 hypothetical protein [Limisphaerales bacterium]
MAQSALKMNEELGDNRPISGILRSIREQNMIKHRQSQPTWKQ